MTCLRCGLPLSRSSRGGLHGHCREKCLADDARVRANPRVLPAPQLSEVTIVPFEPDDQPQTGLPYLGFGEVEP